MAVADCRSFFSDRRAQNDNRPDHYDGHKTRFFPPSTHYGTFGTMEGRIVLIEDYILTFESEPYCRTQVGAFGGARGRVIGRSFISYGN